MSENPYKKYKVTTYIRRGKDGTNVLHTLNYVAESGVIIPLRDFINIENAKRTAEKFDIEIPYWSTYEIQA